MRFRLDENIPLELGELLREAGHDAKTVLDQGLGGFGDHDIAAACLREGRAIITFDTGFADIRRYPPAAYPGIVVLRLNSQSREHTLAVTGRLLRTTPHIDGKSLDGESWIVEETRVRVRT